MEKAVDEGTQVTLTCKVTGARPAANITWLRGGEKLREQTADSEGIQVSWLREAVCIMDLEWSFFNAMRLAMP